ncbi:RlpA-like double-psi beta-barrel domain [Plasmopara halstedii]|uniref:RlpA-like double-psi beta-barrel domain n=1 Tax=Plasmopara halstedii TaxID=4781 RepID=A0A0P1AQ75_PLAHL|nr:RlpA-like double-psi beta-barrel domain [Plasmopara halstedii]CEG43404.1 RlpA-like double-psi beta-barrel domain [Plasmopara halstedii]|eukprot:XP_024579773.1 RlpA-like double-psi beta-barrel domain [Plasmopara halstedii]
MRDWTTIVAIVAVTVEIATASGIVSIYNISDPSFGTCRLKGISESSDNFKFYASVPSSDFSLNNACARCITITRDDNPAISTTAYVLDVCDGCTSGTLELSADSMSALNIDVTDRTTIVSYRFGSCPSSLMSGDISACLMEGASATYVPLQFYNSQKVITSATIEGVPATSTSSSFLYSANSGSTSATWYQNVQFSVESDDGEILNSTFAFSSTSGCASSSVQFNSASTADGVTGNTTSGDSNAGVIGGAVGGTAAVLVIVGSVIMIRRRKSAAKGFSDSGNDVENQYLSPSTKPKSAAAAAATFPEDHDDHQRPASPTVDYAESLSPAASTKDTGVRHSEANLPKALAVHAEPPAMNDPTPLAVKATAVNSSPSSFDRTTNSFSPPGNSTYVAPTYAYSNNVTITSPRPPTSTMKSAPTLSAPIVPRHASNTNYQHYGEDDEEGRSSFDIDDMRESEARATMDLTRRLGSQQSFAPYSSDDTYANAVTSPESNVHGTSLRRPSLQQNSMRASGLDLGRYTNDSVLSDADSYASASRPTNQSILSNNTLLQSSPPSAADNYPLNAQLSGSTEADRMANSISDSYASNPAVHQSRDLATSQSSIGSARESGYSRESLSILGYPYSKKSGRHHNITEMQF